MHRRDADLLWSQFTLPLRVRAIVKEVCDKYDCHPGEALSRRRYHPLPAIRGEIYYKLHALGFSLHRIGSFFDRDHSSVLYALAKYQYLSQSPKLSDYAIDNLRLKRNPEDEKASYPYASVC